ncbi:hypothetical protein [Alteromonas sp. KUL106]|uniref:hypothetical protein n=1 Tax=Alteromonas sp. KUL106 TaxID=2480799 RepID=UPI0012E5B932|nr:hypothetical protein [Alteromonas sp. KUL106]GFD69962.1 hypothetical protein KUL106_32250 [Alteromonas sp. KUL106]GFD78886.1 hypothetical protein KUL118_17480 [Tenacibaculum sp. KUL118]
MKLNPYTNMYKGASIGFFPLLTTLILLSVHYFTGALDWPEAGNVRAQRDFNSAIGMSFITGYFWFALRLMHQNVASTLISLLVKTNQLSQFSAHRRELAAEFKLHLFNAIIISIMITVLYCIFEGLITVKQEIHVLFLTATAVPFWFLAILFLFQISSNIKYLINNVLPQANDHIDRLKSIIIVLKLGTANSIFAMGALAIFPIFWLKKDIPSIDVMGVTFFTGVVAFYLFWPVIKLINMLGKEQKAVLIELDREIEKGIKRCATGQLPATAVSIEDLESEKERVNKMGSRIFAPRDKARVFACIALVPFSWVLLFIVEWITRLPHYR